MSSYAEKHQAYRDALLEYLALSRLEDDLNATNSPDYGLRGDIASRKAEAREAIVKAIK